MEIEKRIKAEIERFGLFEGADFLIERIGIEDSDVVVRVSDGVSEDLFILGQASLDALSLRKPKGPYEHRLGQFEFSCVISRSDWQRVVQGDRTTWQPVYHGFVLLIDAGTVAGPDTVSEADLYGIARAMQVELYDTRVWVEVVGPGQSAGLYSADVVWEPVDAVERDPDLLIAIDAAMGIAKTIVWPAGIDREHRDRVMLAHLAKREAWVDYRSGLDVPSTADWLVACAHRLSARESVMETLGALCRGTMTFHQAAVELDRALD